MKKVACLIIFLSLISCGSLEGDKGKDGQDGRDATTLAVVKNLEEVPCSTENQNRVVFSEENNGWYQCKDKWLRLGLTLADVAHQKLIGDWETECDATEEGSSVSAKLSFDGATVYYYVESFSNMFCDGGTVPREGNARYSLRSDSELDIPSINFFTSINVNQSELLIHGLVSIRGTPVTSNNRWSSVKTILKKTDFPKDENGIPKFGQ